MLLRVFLSVNVLLTTLVVVLGFGALGAMFGYSQLKMVLVGSAFLGSQFIRENYRSLLAVEGRFERLLAVDLTYIGICAGAVCYLQFGVVEPNFWLADLFYVLTGAALVSMMGYPMPCALRDMVGLPREVRQVFLQQKHEIRWSLLGVITTDIQNRGYIFVAAAMFGAATVAQLQAGRIFFGPLNLLTSAWARVARPQFAKLAGDSDSGGFAKVLNQALIVFVVFNVLFLAVLWLVWPLLSELVFGGKYDEIGAFVAAWGVANIAFQMRSCMSVGVQALRRFRELTLATIYGAVASSCVVAVASMADQPSWLIASVIGGECVAMIVIFGILRRRVAVGALV